MKPARACRSAVCLYAGKVRAGPRLGHITQQKSKLRGFDASGRRYAGNAREHGPRSQADVMGVLLAAGRGGGAWFQSRTVPKWDNWRCLLRAVVCTKPGLGHFTCSAVGDGPFGKVQLRFRTARLDAVDCVIPSASATYKECSRWQAACLRAVQRVHNPGWRLS